MRSHELKTGRSFAIAFDHGDDFFTALAAFCRDNEVQQGYIPFFIAGFSEVRIIGTCEKLDDPQAPVRSHVFLTNVEAVGAGTVAYNPETASIEPHIHVAVGLKEHSANGHTSHLVSATVQLLTEMVFVEVTSPALRRHQNPALYNIPLLHFAPELISDDALTFERSRELPREIDLSD